MSVADVKPSAPKVSAEGTAIRFTLGDYMFGPGFDPSSVTVPSACYFGSMRVDGEFDAMKSQLMPAPSLKQITKTSSSANVELRISLDGQIFSDETVMVRYGSENHR